MKTIAKIGSWLASEQYKLTNDASSMINYLLDSWFHRVDERSMAATREYFPDNIDTDARCEFLGCQPSECFKLDFQHPRIFKDRVAFALAKLMEQGAFQEVNFIETYTYAKYASDWLAFNPSYGMAIIGLNHSVSVPIRKMYFLQYGDRRLVVTSNLVDHYQCEFTVYVKNGDNKLAELFAMELSASMVANDIYYKKCLAFDSGSFSFQDITPTSLNSVVMKSTLKDTILQNTVNVLDNFSVLQQLGVCPNRNTLFISPPGMAKSTIFRSISTMTESRATRIWCTGKSIRDAQDVTDLFMAAKSLGPCIIFIEDMDLFGAERSVSSNSVILNEFLSCLDGQSENAGVMVLASTNDLMSMDEALINRPGRFDMKIDIPLPDDEDRRTMLFNFLNRYKLEGDKSVTPEIFNSVVKATDGFTGAYMHELVKSVVINAVRWSKSDGDSCTFNSDDIIAALEQVLSNYKIGQRAKRHHQSEEKPV